MNPDRTATLLRQTRRRRSARPSAEVLEGRLLTTIGLLDPSFGIGGTATVAFDLGGTNDDRAKALAVQPDGKIVLAGSADTGGNTAPLSGEGTAFVVVRLDADGTPDTSFDTEGWGQPRSPHPPRCGGELLEGGRGDHHRYSSLDGEDSPRQDGPSMQGLTSPPSWRTMPWRPARETQG